MLPKFLTLVGLALAIPTATLAQSYVRTDCQPFVSQPALRFDDRDHGLWYRRFWNGNCSGLVFCSSGAPNWNQAVGQIVQRARSADRAAVKAKVCRLGRKIGFEWARDNSIRKIDTQRLSAFYSELNGATDIEAALANVEQEAQAALAQ